METWILKADDQAIKAWGKVDQYVQDDVWLYKYKIM